MLHPSMKPDANTRLDRELERERQQHARNQEAKTGLYGAECDRIKDPRESFDQGKVRR